MLLSNTTKLNKAKRTLLLVVVAAFATLVVFSLFFTGYEQGHECINPPSALSSVKAALFSPYEKNARSLSRTFILI